MQDEVFSRATGSGRLDVKAEPVRTLPAGGQRSIAQRSQGFSEGCRTLEDPAVLCLRRQQQGVVDAGVTPAYPVRRSTPSSRARAPATSMLGQGGATTAAFRDPTGHGAYVGHGDERLGPTSASGQELPIRWARAMSAWPSNAVKPETGRDVRNVPRADERRNSDAEATDRYSGSPALRRLSRRCSRSSGSLYGAMPVTVHRRMVACGSNSTTRATALRAWSACPRAA